LEKTHKGTNRKNPEIRTDNPNDTIDIGGVEIQLNEHPQYYDRPDITKGERWTLKNSIDKGAYRDWIKYSRKIIYNERRYYTSNKGNIRLALRDLIFSSKVTMLSELEREKATELHIRWKKNFSKAKKAAVRALDYNGNLGSLTSN